MLLAWAGCTPPLDITPGTVLTYQVDNLGLETHAFIVTVHALGPDREVTFEMPDKAQGRIRIAAEALRTATAQRNYFTTDTYELRDTTTIWVSDRVYQALVAGQPLTIQLGEGDEELQLADRTTRTVLVDGQPRRVPILHAVTTRNKQFWIWDNPAQPLIWEMDLGWTIRIESVKTPS